MDQQQLLIFDILVSGVWTSTFCTTNTQGGFYSFTTKSGLEPSNIISNFQFIKGKKTVRSQHLCGYRCIQSFKTRLQRPNNMHKGTFIQIQDDLYLVAEHNIVECKVCLRNLKMMEEKKSLMVIFKQFRIKKLWEQYKKSD